MPSGKIHTAASLVVATVCFPVALGLGLDLPDAIGCSSGALTGILVNCDRDVDSGNISNYFIRKYAGEIVEFVWRIVWYPYAKICKHRGFLSHSPILSTLIRLLYLSIWFGPIVYWLGWWKWYPWMAWWVVGLMLSDAVHGALDWADKVLFKGRL